MINMNEGLDLNRSVYEDSCKDGDFDAYKCVYVIVQSRQKIKKKRAPLTQKETAHTKDFLFRPSDIYRHIALPYPFFLDTWHPSQNASQLVHLVEHLHQQQFANERTFCRRSGFIAKTFTF